MNWIIGDIHGHLQKLKSVLEQIYQQDKSPTIYCVGDCCDRGPDSKGVVDLILAEGIHCVRGNHDDIFDCVINGRPTRDGDMQGSDAPLKSLFWFLQFGMDLTLDSYQISRDVYKKAWRNWDVSEFCKNIPESHKQFYANLPSFIETDQFFITHAYISVHDEILKETAFTGSGRREMLWGRFSKLDIDSLKMWKKTGYFGHTPVQHYNYESPIEGPNIVLVDMGVHFGNQLAAYCHETKQVIRSRT